MVHDTNVTVAISRLYVQSVESPRTGYQVASLSSTVKGRRHTGCHLGRRLVAIERRSPRTDCACSHIVSRGTSRRFSEASATVQPHPFAVQYSEERMDSYVSRSIVTGSVRSRIGAEKYVRTVEAK